jgi:uncharacterized protein YbaA (DUF1428 family)
MSYVDGFVLPVPKDKIDAYREMASKAAVVWKDHGALQYVEAVGDDLEIKDVFPFTQLGTVQEGETMVFAWIMYKSREHRDEVNKKVMEDPRIKEMCDPKDMPFDCARMAYGGFKVIVES